MHATSRTNRTNLGLLVGMVGLVGAFAGRPAFAQGSGAAPQPTQQPPPGFEKAPAPPTPVPAAGTTAGQGQGTTPAPAQGGATPPPGYPQGYPPPGYPPGYPPPGYPPGYPPPGYPQGYPQGYPPPGYPYGYPPPGYGPYRYPPRAAEELPYNEEKPIPQGYHVETRTRTGLFGAGIGLFASFWGISVLSGLLIESLSFSSSTHSAWPLLLPGIGPFITISTLDTEELGTPILLIDGLAQSAGLAMLIAAVAAPEKLLRRNAAGMTMQLVPLPIKGGAGLGLVGTM